MSNNKRAEKFQASVQKQYVMISTCKRVFCTQEIFTRRNVECDNKAEYVTKACVCYTTFEVDTDDVKH